MRLDLYLVHCGLAPSRAKAQELIRNGDVEIQSADGWHSAAGASTQMRESDQVRLRSKELLKYVSRGGLKLEAALDHLKLEVTGLVAFDVGISTGGFTDCLLQRGVKRVVGVDVGSGQLAAPLQGEARLQLFEGLNGREMSQNAELKAAASEVKLCVMDLSFISLTLVLPEVVKLLPPHRLLALVKPQFELSATALNKNGVVKHAEDLERATARVQAAATALGYHLMELFPCKWKGGDGNQEFFLYATKDTL